MSTTKDRRTITVDLEDDLEGDVPSDVPKRATLEVDRDGDRKTVRIEHGTDEWTFEFEDGHCVDRDPATRPIPQWLAQALEKVKGEIQ